MADAALNDKSLKNRRKGAKFDNQTSEKLRQPRAPKSPKSVDQEDSQVTSLSSARPPAEAPTIEMDWTGAAE